MLQKKQPFYMTKNGAFVIDPTVAAGDFQISVDGGLFEDLDNLPVVVSGTPIVNVELSATEAAGSTAVIKAIDPDGQWSDQWWQVPTRIKRVTLSNTTTNVSDIETDEVP